MNLHNLIKSVICTFCCAAIFEATHKENQYQGGKRSVKSAKPKDIDDFGLLVLTNCDFWMLKNLNLTFLLHPQLYLFTVILTPLCDQS